MVKAPAEPRRLIAAWVLWSVFAAFGVLVYLVYFNHALLNIVNSSQVLKSYLLVDDLISFPAFAAVFTWMRTLAVMIFLLAAFICIIHVALPGGPYALFSMLTALM